MNPLVKVDGSIPSWYAIQASPQIMVLQKLLGNAKVPLKWMVGTGKVVPVIGNLKKKIYIRM